MRKFSLTRTRQLAVMHNIDLAIVPLDEFKDGLDIEREHLPYLTKHLPKSKLEDAVVEIALAHLEEDPRYYFYLKKQEIKRDAYWSTRNKPRIYTD